MNKLNKFTYETVNIRGKNVSSRYNFYKKTERWALRRITFLILKSRRLENALLTQTYLGHVRARLTNQTLPDTRV